MHSLMHVLGGLVLLMVALTAGGSILGRQVARSWDIVRPGTRPSRRQAAGWARSRVRHPRGASRRHGEAPEPDGPRVIHEDCEVVPGERPRPAATPVRPAPGAAGELTQGGAATHVIAYLPPFLLRRKDRRRSPEGTWDLQEARGYAAHEPPDGGDWTLGAPRSAEPAALAEWAGARLGYPVRLERGTGEGMRPWWLPFGRGTEAPVWHVRPAPLPPRPAAPAYGASRPASPDQEPLTGRIVTPVTTPAVPAAGSPAVIAPGTEEMTTGMALLRSWAVAGNAQHKERAFRDLVDAYEQHAAFIDSLGTSMEEDSRYPAGIIEEVRRMALVLRALSMQSAEVEGRIGALLDSTARELIQAGNLAPERRELLAEPGGL